MKQRLTIAFLGMLLLSCAAYATDLGLSESIIDYGTVKEGPAVIKTVILTNNGAQSITIVKAASS